MTLEQAYQRIGTKVIRGSVKAEVIVITHKPATGVVYADLKHPSGKTERVPAVELWG